MHQFLSGFKISVHILGNIWTLCTSHTFHKPQILVDIRFSGHMLCTCVSVWAFCLHAVSLFSPEIFWKPCACWTAPHCSLLCPHRDLRPNECVCVCVYSVCVYNNTCTFVCTRLCQDSFTHACKKIKGNSLLLFHNCHPEKRVKTWKQWNNSMLWSSFSQKSHLLNW